MLGRGDSAGRQLGFRPVRKMMNEAKGNVATAAAVDFLRPILKGQYHASLAMLREALEKCPEDLWYSQDQVNAFWQTAYHTLFFAHLYLLPSSEHFTPWRHHQSNVQHEDAQTGPGDANSTLPLIPNPYTPEQVLEYWEFCDG